MVPTHESNLINYQQWVVHNLQHIYYKIRQWHSVIKNRLFVITDCVMSIVFLNFTNRL